MLVIFAFSMTPKVILHNLIVDHKDTHIPSGKDAQVGKTGFLCDCESQVVVLPYLNHVDNYQLKIPRSFQIYRTPVGYSFHSVSQFIFGLRGPPFAV